MKEQISLGGAPVVGFGDASGAKSSDPSLAASLVGFSIGGLAGAAIGAMVGKGKGAAVGALIGGIGGGVITYATAAKAANSSPQTTSTATTAWHRLSLGDPISEGQPLFVTISSPNGLDPTVVASISTSLENWSGRAKNSYPPGSTGPVDSPADDTRGPAAYRFTVVANTDDHFTPDEISKAMPPVPLTIEAWAKTPSSPSSPQMLTPTLNPVPDTSSAGLVGPQYLTKYTTTAYQMAALPDPKRPVMLCSYVPYFSADATNLSVAERQLANMRANHESATESLYGINGRRWIVTLKKRYFDPKTFKELPSDMLYESTNKFSVPTSPDPGVPCG